MVSPCAHPPISFPPGDSCHLQTFPCKFQIPMLSHAPCLGRQYVRSRERTSALHELHPHCLWAKASIMRTPNICCSPGCGPIASGGLVSINRLQSQILQKTVQTWRPLCTSARSLVKLLDVEAELSHVQSDKGACCSGSRPKAQFVRHRRPKYVSKIPNHLHSILAILVCSPMTSSV